MGLKENLLLLLVSIGVAILIQVFLEWTNHADSLGWWYVAYSALIYALPVFLVLKIGLRWWRSSAEKPLGAENIPGQPPNKN